MLRTVVFLFLSIYYVVCDNEYSKLEIAKCCAENEAILNNNCKKFNTGEMSFSKIKVYDKNIHNKPILKPFSDIFRVVLDKRPSEEDFQNFYYNYEQYSQIFLSENGILYIENPNTYKRWIPMNNSFYCVDYELLQQENSTEFEVAEKPSFYCADVGEQPKPTSSFLSAALLVSAFFLLLVLIVYMLLPGLRNLGGMILMAYVFSLMLAFVFLAIVQIFEHEADTCIGLTTTVYFFFLASFCWMTVMSYDIWWTFRGYAKARFINRRGETFKFLMYCMYGWGVPLAMSVAFVVINSSDLSHIPSFVKPQVPDMGCFLEGGQKLVYLYAPMLILILSNWIFFLMTAFNIWRLHRGTAMLDSPACGTPQAHRNQKNRLFIYLKLSIIMGINWILEVVSSLAPDFAFWYLTDAYNLLIGLAIFLIFVCKKKILRQLKARFNMNDKQQESISKNRSSTTLSTVSQDVPLQVLPHPNGTSAKFYCLEPDLDNLVSLKKK